MLLVAACHLRHVSPRILQHRIAEHFHQSLVLRDLQRIVDLPRESLGQANVDALLVSAAMLNMVAFTLPNSEDCLRTDTQTSWVLSTRDDRLGWLSLQVGLRPLLLSMGAYLESAIDLLGPIFFNGQFSRVSHDLGGVPQIWKDFFELEDSGSGCDSNNIQDSFRAPVTILIQLRELEPIPSNLFKNLQFLGKVQQDFQALLFRRNEKALWLFGYWLGVMCRYGKIWWCGKRSRKDYDAICTWLERALLGNRPGIEGKMWTLMMEELFSVPKGN
jgi:hypothetical protein